MLWVDHPGVGSNRCVLVTRALIATDAFGRCLVTGRDVHLVSDEGEGRRAGALALVKTCTFRRCLLTKFLW